jgi:hypothetical protein
LERGYEGLEELSRRPHSQPEQLAVGEVCAIVRLKQEFPYWGARKIQAVYGRRYGQAVSESTIKRFLERSGLVHKRKERKASQTGRLSSGRKAQGVNEVWTVDFKGWWWQGPERCQALSVRDEYSCNILECTSPKKQTLSCPFFWGKYIRPEEPLIKELRLLCRDEVTLIEQRTAFVQQLRHALAEYYPAALEAFGDWTSVSAWMFLQRFPTPGALAQAGKRQWQKFLHSRRLWGSDQGPRRMEIFAHASEFAGTQPTINAKSLLALSLVQMLFSVEKQLAVYRQRIEELFARHPDHDLFGSLPGAGPQIAHALLSEIGDNRQRFDGDAQALQCLGGTAPVTKRSGKYRHVYQRWACDKHLRHAIYLFAEQSLSRCVWAELYYRHHRQKDRSHANAIRRLGHRWLKIIHKMWIERTPYHAELHHRNQLQHGSWIFKLKPS